MTLIGDVLGTLRAGLDRSAIWELARQLPRASPRLAALVCALMAVEAVVPAARAVASGALVGSQSAVLAEGFDSPAGRRFDLALAAVALSFVLQMSLPPWRGAASDALARRFMGGTFERIMRATLSPPTVAHLEDPATYDQISRARNEHWVGPRNAANALIEQIAGRLRGAGAVVLIAGFDWRLALLLLGVHQWRNQRLVAVHRQILANLPAILAMALTVGLVARAGLEGAIDVGAVVTYAGAAFIVFNNLGWEPFEAGRLEYGAAGLRSLAQLEADMIKPRFQLGGSRTADGLPRHELRLESVHFHYPGTETAVLRGLDLVIPALRRPPRRGRRRSRPRAGLERGDELRRLVDLRARLRVGDLAGRPPGGGSDHTGRRRPHDH